MTFFQARNVQTNEAVAIKKMSYSGKQSIEVSGGKWYTRLIDLY